MGVNLLLTSFFDNTVPNPAATHHFCNQQAMIILRSLREHACVDFLNTYLATLDAGSSWADSSFKNATHFFNPQTKKGKWYFPHALKRYNHHVAKAQKFALLKKYQKTAFYLGAAGHLIQDMCVPHHSNGVLFDGHQTFENWAYVNREKYVRCNYSSKPVKLPPTGWLVINALKSQKYYPLVSEKSREKNFPQALSFLLPLAQQSSAGFYHQFIINNI